MKKFVCMILLMATMLVMLTSCIESFINTIWENQEKIEPGNQIMTKWEADDFELYITEENTGLLIWNRQDKTMAYDIEFMGGGTDSYYAYVFDRRLQYMDFDYYLERKVLGQEEYEYQGYMVAYPDYEPINETTFMLEFGDTSNVTNSFPEEELRFCRTATDLTKEDIPIIEPDEAYENCPIYSLGSKWVSEDQSIVIEMEEEYEMVAIIFHRCPIGNVTISDSEETNLQIIFSETDSLAYVGALKKQGSGLKPYDVAQASHILQCEFFEEYFLATVVSSDRYEEGTTMKFIRQTE